MEAHSYDFVIFHVGATKKQTKTRISRKKKKKKVMLHNIFSRLHSVCFAEERSGCDALVLLLGVGLIDTSH